METKVSTLVTFEPHRELHPFERLLSSLSSSMCALDVDEALAQITVGLETIGVAFGVEECTLVSYRDRDEARVTASWATPPRDPWRNEDLTQVPWLLHRVARNTVVSVTAGADWPQSAQLDRAHAERTGIASRLALPVVLGTRVCFALIVGSRHRQPDWNAAVIERLRLLAETVAGGVERLLRQESQRATDAATPDVEREVPLGGDGIIGRSPAIRVAVGRLHQVAPLDVTVLLCGETGTGKELFARALHEHSRRHGAPFVCVNCAALPPTLIESELFGHERGAFTGATAMRQGRFELADGGTLFLDEIGDLAPELQAKLLRALQEGEFERVGSCKMRRADVRVIAATHVDLEQAVAEDRFRADLYYRLNVFPILLPPLRERREDIPDLVWTFIEQRQRTLGRRITSVPANVMSALTQHDWPGNVRELENVIDRALIRTTGDALQLDSPLDAVRRVTGTPEGGTLDAVQRQYIEKVLRECGGRINGAGNAAVRLGLHPNTLRFRIKKLGVAVPRREGAAEG